MPGRRRSPAASTGVGLLEGRTGLPEIGNAALALGLPWLALEWQHEQLEHLREGVRQMANAQNSRPESQTPDELGGPDPVGRQDELGAPGDTAGPDTLGGPDPAGREDELADPDATTPGPDDLGGPDPTGREDELSDET